MIHHTIRCNEGWVYNDNVNSPEIRKWLGEAVGKEGDTLDRHDRWFVYDVSLIVVGEMKPAADGVIFVSIDDYAIHHLRLLMDEILN